MFCHFILGYVLEYVLGSPNPPKQGLGQPCAPQNAIETHQDLAKTRQIGLEMPAHTLLNAPKTPPRCNTGALKPAKGAPDRPQTPPRNPPRSPKPLQGLSRGSKTLQKTMPKRILD